MTKEELAAENERLGQEVAALRTLLAAVRDAADVPLPAGDSESDWRSCINTSARRADLIAIYANPDGARGPVSTETLHNAAKVLRDEAARPLRYEPKAAK